MKILILGSSGTGKSTLAKRLKEILMYPVLHLDKVYHTGVGKEHISREEFVKKVTEFTSSNEDWIIDGNYTSTLEMRVKLADVIILLKMPTEICLENVMNRYAEVVKNGKNRDDIAEGFDETITDEFIDHIKNFNYIKMPIIEEILARYKDKSIKIINDYTELEEFVEFIRSNK